MMLVRVLAAFAKPALFGGAITATVVGGYAGYTQWRGDDPTPFQQLQSQGQRLLISEFAENADTILAVNPDDAGDRTEIAVIEHATGYGIFATLSPDGEAIAYTALPPDAASAAPDAPALAAIVDVDGSVTLLADDVDLLIPPVWAPDSGSIVVRKNTAAENDNGSFELVALSRDGARDTITTWNSAAVFPIAFAPDGSKLYFATLNESGTNLYSVAPDGADETLIAHLSDEIARDWRLSPDGSKLAYSVAESGDTPRIVAMTLDLATASATRVTGDADRAEYAPAWNADGALTISSADAKGAGDTLAFDGGGGERKLSSRPASLDLPLAWSPDGATLAVRSVGASESRIELLAEDGTRRPVSDAADVLIVGWLD